MRPAGIFLSQQLRPLLPRPADEGGTIESTTPFEDHMVTTGYDPAYGARPIKRLMQRELVNQLAKAILSGTVHKDSVIEVDAVGGQIVLNNKK